MNREEIIRELRAERDRIHQAIELLDNSTTERVEQQPERVVAIDEHKPKRHLSDAARKRISIAVKRRWRENRKQA